MNSILLSRPQQNFCRKLDQTIARWLVLRGVLLSIPAAEFLRESHRLWWKIADLYNRGLGQGYGKIGAPPALREIQQAMARAVSILMRHPGEGSSRNISSAKFKEQEATLGADAMAFQKKSCTFSEYKEKNKDHIHHIWEGLP